MSKVLTCVKFKLARNCIFGSKESFAFSNPGHRFLRLFSFLKAVVREDLLLYESTDFQRIRTSEHLFLEFLGPHDAVLTKSLSECLGFEYSFHSGP